MYLELGPCALVHGLSLKDFCAHGIIVAMNIRSFAPLATLILLSVSPLLAYERIPIPPEQIAAGHRAYLLDQAGKDAARAHDYADAELDFRAAIKLQPFFTDYANLALALDHGGKREEAFQVYRQAFGSPIGTRFSGTSEESEGIARFGIMCEDRGLHRDAVRCFNAADTRRMRLGVIGPLDAWAAKSTSSSLMRALLKIIEGCASEEEGRFGKDRSGDALASFQAAVRLAPSDPRPQFALASGLLDVGRFAEAKAAFHKVSQLDKRGDLKFATEQSLSLIREKRQK